jgi:hypothetical protein
VADIEADSFPRQFDCVFVRGLSLYNRPDFSQNSEVTKNLLRLMNPSGVLMFLYHSNCSSRKATHSDITPESNCRVISGSFEARGFLFLQNRRSFAGTIRLYETLYADKHDGEQADP